MTVLSNMANRLEKAEGTTRKRIMRVLKLLSKSEQEATPAEPADTPRQDQDSQHGASTAGSEARAVDKEIRPSLGGPVTTMSDPQEGSGNHDHGQEGPRVLQDSPETPHQSSSHQETSSPEEMPLENARQPSPIPLTPSTTLWDEAYGVIQRCHQKLVYRYETILSLDLGKAAAHVPPRAPTFDIFENLINQQDPKVRRTQMNGLLNTWRDKDDYEKLGKSEELQQEGGDDEGTASLQHIIQKVMSAMPEEAIAAVVGICYASKILLHPTFDNKKDCEDLIYVISRMEWYCLLPNLLGKGNEAGMDSHGDLGTRIINLYAAIMSYVMYLTCSNSNNLAFDSDSEMFQAWSRSVSLETIKTAEEEIPLYNKDRVKLPLERLLGAVTAEKEVFGNEKEELSKEHKGPLKHLRSFDSRGQPQVSDPDEAPSQVMHDLYELLLNTEEYKLFLDWDALDHQLFWVSAGAGQGKTMLLDSAARALKRSNPGQADFQHLSSFFFDSNQPRYDNATAALSNLIASLINQQPLLGHYLEKKMETTGRMSLDSPNDFIALSGVFLELIEDESFSNTYFVIDALDECSSDKGRPGLDDLLTLIINSTKLSKKVRWLVSSENSARMCLKFKQTATMHLDLGTDLDDSRTVMNNYIHFKVSKVAECKGYDEKLKEIVIGLCEKRLYNYLWVDIVCTALRAEEVWHVEDFLQEIEMIKDLESLYGRLGDKITGLSKDASLCIEVLETMAVVRQSLHVNELEPLVLLPRRVNLMAILEKCSAFLRVRDGFVSFQHHSARDHVRKHVLTHTSSMERHMKLTRHSLEYIARSLESRDARGVQVTRMENDHVNRNDAPVAAKYASLHWMTHLYKMCKAFDNKGLEEKSEVDLISDISLFLQEQFVPWVEALVAENQLPIVTVRMQKLDLYLQGKSSSPKWKELHAAIRDSHQFLRLHRWTNSPKEVAASNTLLFCPMESSIRKSLTKDKFPWVTSPPKMDQSWTDSFATLEGHRDWVRTIAFSADGRFIASGSDDSTVRIWDAETGTTQHSLNIHGDWIYCVAFSPQNLVAAGSDDYSITIWEATTGRELAYLEDHEGNLQTLCFSPDGKKLVSADSWELRIWEAKSEDFKEWVHHKLEENDDVVHSAAFSKDGTMLATGKGGGSICIWDAATHKPLQTFEAHKDSINSVAFSGDGKHLASGADDGTAVIWDVSIVKLKSKNDEDSENDEEGSEIERARLHTLNPGAGNITTVAFSPNDKGLRLATATSKAIHIWDTYTGKMIQCLSSPLSKITSIAFAPNGSYLASGSYNSAIHLWYASGTAMSAGIAEQPPTRRAIYEMAVSPDSRILACAVSGGSVFLWDLQTDEKIPRSMEFAHKRDVKSLSFSPDGDKLLSGSYDTSVRVCKVETGECLNVFSGHKDWVRDVAWGKDGTYAVSASDDSSIRVWEIGGDKYAEPLQVLESAHEGSYSMCVAVCPDGKYLASGGLNDKVVAWERCKDGTWNNKKEYLGHSGSVLAVVVTPEPKRIISASSDGTVRIWDIETKETRRTIQIHWGLYKMWLTPQPAESIMTSQGILSLNSSRSASQSPACSPWRLQCYGYGDQWWVTFEDQKVIFLPRTFQPMSACVLEDKVIVGTSLGQIHVYRLSKDLFLGTA